MVIRVGDIRVLVFWQGSYDNSGYTVGQVDEEGELTGDEIAYIYPDFKMAIRGKFIEGELIEGFQCDLVGCYDDHGIMVPVFSDPSGPAYEFEVGQTVKIFGGYLVKIFPPEPEYPQHRAEPAAARPVGGDPRVRAGVAAAAGGRGALRQAGLRGEGGGRPLQRHQVQELHLRRRPHAQVGMHVETSNIDTKIFFSLGQV